MTSKPSLDLYERDMEWLESWTCVVCRGDILDGPIIDGDLMEMHLDCGREVADRLGVAIENDSRTKQ